MTLPLHETLLSVGPDAPFVSKWRTAAAGETITLPLSGGAGSSYGFVVDWGDGTNSVVTSATDLNRTHAYATPGDHVVKITGTLIGWAFNNAGNKLEIRSVDQWGCLRFINVQAGHFYGCSNLQIFATEPPVLSANCTNMFRSCTSFISAPNISNWDTSGVSNMSDMFNGATVFDGNIGSWNTASVTNMANMFNAARAFNSDIGLWKTSAVTSMEGMFQNAILFDQNVGSWNTAAVKNMSSMFSGASKFNQNLNSWNTSAVTSMAGMFSSASKFNQDLHSWSTAAVTNMGNMFNNALVFNGDINSWNTAAVTNMASMFSDARSFNCGQPSGIVHTLMKRTATGGWKVGGITSANMSLMFNKSFAFAGDISTWCADAATTLPTNFATAAHANFTPALQPTWGACPIPD